MESDNEMTAIVMKTPRQVVDGMIADINAFGFKQLPLAAMSISDGFDLFGAMRDAEMFDRTQSELDAAGGEPDHRVTTLEYLLDTAQYWDAQAA